MGIVEKEARKKRTYTHIQEALFTTVALSGIVLVSAVAPGLPGAIAKLSGTKGAKLRYQYRTALGRLAAQGHIKFEKRGGQSYARITPKGRKVFEFERQKLKLKDTKRGRWNKRWRVVIFDIPERRRKTRDRLRKTMGEVGFVRLQDSVWVFPYDCEDFLTLLKSDLKIGSAVLYMVVEQIENDKHLKAHFGLK